MIWEPKLPKDEALPSPATSSKRKATTTEKSAATLVLCIYVWLAYLVDVRVEAELIVISSEMALLAVSEMQSPL